MKILGINGVFNGICHFPSAALVIDGKLISFKEEERFTRIKESKNQYPITAITNILIENKLTINDIDIISTPDIDWSDNSQLIDMIIDVLGGDKKHKPILIYRDHHTGHIYESFFQSGFDDSAFLVVDGYGDRDDSISIGIIDKNDFKILKKYNIKQSLGKLYSNVSMRIFDGVSPEGKLMGLSSYGVDTKYRVLSWDNLSKDIINNIYSHIKDTDESDYDEDYSQIIFKNIYPFQYPEHQTEIQYYSNMAKTIQNNFNEIIYELLKYTKEITQKGKIVLSGGCFQNCISNNIICESGLFKEYYCSPIPHDGGTSIGYAFYAAQQVGDIKENVKRKNSYYGKEYNIDLSLVGLPKKGYLQQDIIDKLKNKEIICWFQGGAEGGPRALGHRSILASPQFRENLSIINSMKQRENWRPLAPIVPEELFDEIFDVKNHDLFNFMLRTIKIKNEWLSKIPAICHIDGTTRPQLLKKNINPELYNLIMEFYKQTGIPCLVNTSLNGKGEPIVETPSDAIKFILNCKENCYIIFNNRYMVSKTDINEYYGM